MWPTDEVDDGDKNGGGGEGGIVDETEVWADVVEQIQNAAIVCM